MKKEEARSFAKDAADRLRTVGILEITCTSSSCDVADFGNAEAIFHVGSMFLRFIRERGQEFLDVASDVTPSRFHQFSDVEIAMGWRTIEEVLAQQEPERLEIVLVRLAQHLALLNHAFSGEQERLTRARVERAAHARGKAFADHLRGKK